MIRLDQFSLGWCVSIIFLHAAISWGLGLLLFVGGMGSFTYGPGTGYYVTEALLWIWSPLAMTAAKINNGFEGATLALALLWSLIFGVLSGFVIPLFVKPKTPKPLPPGANPDLVGTPWEQKATVRFKTLREASAEQKSVGTHEPEMATPKKPFD